MMGMTVNRWCVLSFLVLLCVVQYFIFHMLLENGANVDQKGSNLRPSKSVSQTDREPISDSKESLTVTDTKPNATNVGIYSNPVTYKPLNHAYHADAATPRIAVLLPYLGKSLPSWFDLFAFSALASSSLVDCYIFITEAPSRVTPSNVHLIRVSRAQMFQRLAQLDQSYINTTSGKDKLESYFQYIIDVHPYILVEIKPALGFLFADYAEGYSHWAYADLDLLVGNMHLQITPDQLARHDIITLAFGDNNRLYMRGQLTIHKNTPKMRQLWTGCEYLSRIGTRMEEFFEKKTPWGFQSAEGCYSKVVADRTDLSVLYVPVQFSDAFSAPMDQKETIMLGSALLRCYEAEISPAVMIAASQEVLRTEQLGNEPVLYPLRRITQSPDCSYWIHPQYQTCTEYVPANASICIDKGVMTYTQENKYTHEHCREASIAHFQGWKRAYYSYTTRVPPLDARAMVITDVGVVPLRLPQHPELLTYWQLHPAEKVIYGRIDAVTSQTLAISAQTAAELLSKAQNRLIKGPVQVEPSPDEEILVSSYCIRFSGDLKKCEQYVHTDDIQVLQVGESAQSSPNHQVTLISAGWLAEYTKHMYDRLMSVHDGRKVLVLAYTDIADLSSFVSHTPSVTIIAVRVAPTVTGDTKTGTEEWAHLPDKTLYNIGLDAAGETIALVVPSNVILRSFSSVSSTDTVDRSAKFKLSGDAIVEALSAASQQAGHVQPTALVVAMFTKRLVAEHPSSGLTGTGRHTAVLEAYPAVPDTDSAEGDGGVNKLEQCGREQPAALTPSWEAADWADEPILPFNGQELCREFTVMSPVVFNTSASPHGSGFVRFPEELNGVGCYGANILRVLAGSGYSLHWFPARGAQHGMYAQVTGTQTTAMIVASPAPETQPMSEEGKHRQLTAAKGGALKSDMKCGCLYGDTAKRWEMVVKTNKFFLKAVELRMLGLRNTYSRQRFGITFEQDQRTES